MPLPPAVFTSSCAAPGSGLTPGCTFGSTAGPVSSGLTRPNLYHPSGARSNFTFSIAASHTGGGVFPVRKAYAPKGAGPSRSNWKLSRYNSTATAIRTGSTVPSVLRGSINNSTSSFNARSTGTRTFNRCVVGSAPTASACRKARSTYSAAHTVR